MVSRPIPSVFLLFSCFLYDLLSHPSPSWVCVLRPPLRLYRFVATGPLSTRPLSPLIVSSISPLVLTSPSRRLSLVTADANKSLDEVICIPRSRPDMQSPVCLHQKHSILSALRIFHFKDITEYLEGLVNPRLARFINCTPTLRALDETSMIVPPASNFDIGHLGLAILNIFVEGLEASGPVPENIWVVRCRATDLRG